MTECNSDLMSSRFNFKFKRTFCTRLVTQYVQYSATQQLRLKSLSVCSHDLWCWLLWTSPKLHYPFISFHFYYEFGSDVRGAQHENGLTPTSISHQQLCVHAVLRCFFSVD